MNGHELERHEEELARILTGAGDARDAFEATSLAACTTCRSIVEEHVELARSLDALARSEATDVRRALEGPELPEGRAEVALRRALVRESAAPARSPLVRRAWIAAGTAAALLVGLWFLRGGPRRDPGPALGAGVELVHPVHEVESFAPFQWKDEGPRAGWYRVVVFPLDAPGSAQPTDSGPVREQSWTPPPGEVERWGPYIRWTVEVYGGAGEGDLVDSEGTWARLSTR